MIRVFKYPLIFFFFLIFDFLSKFLVVHHLPLIQMFSGYPFGGIGVFKSSILTISIVHAQNTGAAWSLFSNYHTLLFAGRILIALGVFAYLCFSQSSKSHRFPLSLILAGACGNILDTFLYGHVVDMIYCIFYKYSYPIFNLADATICFATIYLFLSSFKKKRVQHVS